MATLKDSGKRLKQIRGELGLRQADFGKLFGKKQRDISHYEQGRLPGHNMLCKLYEMGYSIDWLVTGNGEMHLGGSGDASSAVSGKKTIPVFDINDSSKKLKMQIKSLFQDGTDPTLSLNPKEQNVVRILKATLEEFLSRGSGE